MKNISTIKAKYSRLRKDWDYTKLFDELDVKSKTIIEAQVEFLNLEIPILVFIPNSQYWWVLTNSRLIISDLSDLKFIQLDSLENVSLDGIFSGKEVNNSSIELNLRNGGRLILNVEKDSWHVIFSMLKFMIS